MVSKNIKLPTTTILKLDFAELLHACTISECLRGAIPTLGVVKEAERRRFSIFSRSHGRSSPRSVGRGPFVSTLNVIYSLASTTAAAAAFRVTVSIFPPDLLGTPHQVRAAGM